MHAKIRCVFLFFVTGLASLNISADAGDAPEKIIAYRGAKILTATDAVFDPGTMLVSGGKITAIGPVDQISIPEGTEIVDFAGKILIPGLVDTHSHIGVMSRPIMSSNSDGNESTGPVQSIVRALDAINPFDPGIKMALAGGVTTANVMPGSGNVIGGQTIYIKLRGFTPEQMWIMKDGVYGGLKMANGENPKRNYGSQGKAPGTRMKVAALQRAEFLKAKQYLAKWDRYREQLSKNETPTPPEVDISLEPLVEVLQGKRTVHFHTHRADDVMTVLRLKDEFGFDLVIQHGTESYKVYDEIAKRNVPVSMTVPDSPGGKAEVVDLVEECGAELHRAGVKVLVNTDDPITESRFLLRTAAITVRGGLPNDVALKSVTLHGAQVMRLDDRIGSLEAGKDADFVVLSGEPFSVYTRVLATYIEGEKVFDLSDAKQRLYQTGGFEVAAPLSVPQQKELTAPAPASPAPAVSEGTATPTADDTEFYILAGRVHTVANGTIENAVIAVKEGKIAAVGNREQVQIPAGAKVLAAAAVSPGLIDAHTVVPLSGEYNIPADQDADEPSDPNQADVRVLDAFNPSEPLMRFLLEQGVTVVHACPGRDNVIAGATGVFRTFGRTADAMTIKFPHSMLFNLGNAPKEAAPGRAPGTRMGTAAILRKALSDAVNYRRKQEQAQKEGTPPATDLKLEALSLVLDKKVGAMFIAQQANDLVTALRLIRDYSLDGRLALAADGFLISGEIKQAGVPVVVHPTMQRIGSLESFNTFLGNAAALTDAEIRVAIGSGYEGYVPKTRVVRYEAAIAAVHGLGFERALRSVTLDAAKILGVDDRFGSIEVGKTADLVLYDGDPFEYRTHTTHVVVDGKVVFNRATRERLPLAQRAFLFSPEPACCLEF